ncbi:hypothetical protein BVRB_2g035520 [Beta vulgaris subsp. vulgaris]|nr:hypothetical protein BVRB_2g035520 [Beta vulgaris subsp. vulgaris]
MISSIQLVILPQFGFEFSRNFISIFRNQILLSQFISSISLVRIPIQYLKWIKGFIFLPFKFKLGFLARVCRFCDFCFGGGLVLLLFTSDGSKEFLALCALIILLLSCVLRMPFFFIFVFEDSCFLVLFFQDFKCPISWLNVQLASFQHWASKLVIWCIQLANSNLLCSGANPLHVSEFNEINQVVSVFFTFSWLDHLTSVLLFVRMDETINFLPWIRVLVMKIIKSSAFFIRLNGMKAGGLPLEGVLLNALWIFEKVVILFLLNWQPIYFPYMIASKVLTKPPGCWVMSVVVCYWWLCHYVAAARFVWDRDYGEDIKSSPFQGICYELQHLQFPEIKVLCFSCEVVHYSGFLLSMKRLRIVAHKICLVSKGEEKSLLNSCIKLYFFQSHQKGSCKVSSKMLFKVLPHSYDWFISQLYSSCAGLL